MTVFLTTHYMEEAANADKIVIINKGEIIDEGSPIELKNKYTKDVLKIYQPTIEIINYLEINSLAYSQDKESIVIEVKLANKTIEILNDLKPYISSFEVISGSMDDVFLNVLSQG